MAKGGEMTDNDWEMVYKLIRTFYIAGSYVIVPGDVYDWMAKKWPTRKEY